MSASVAVGTVTSVLNLELVSKFMSTRCVGDAATMSCWVSDAASDVAPAATPITNARRETGARTSGESEIAAFMPAFQAPASAEAARQIHRKAGHRPL